MKTLITVPTLQVENFFEFDTVLDAFNRVVHPQLQGRVSSPRSWWVFPSQVMLLMGLGNTMRHRDVTRIHSTTHPFLRCEIISRHALSLHSLHAHSHWSRCRSVVNSMSTWLRWNQGIPSREGFTSKIIML